MNFEDTPEDNKIFTNEKKLENEENRGPSAIVIEDELLAMSSKIRKMRERFNNVQNRFDTIGSGLEDGNIYIQKLERIKANLEEQERELSDKMNERTQQNFTNYEIEDEEETLNDESIWPIKDLDLNKNQKEKYNEMIKLKCEISALKECEKNQLDRLAELKRIKDLVVTFLHVENDDLK